MSLPPPVPTAPKKGMPAIAWVGIGCGTLVIIAVVALSLLVGFCKRTLDEFQKNPEKAAAEMIVRAHPELELVQSDEAAGTLTIRHQNGEEITLSYDDIKEGRFSVTDAKGNTTQIGAGDLSRVPGWVPRIPGVSGDIGAFHNEDGDKISGFYTVSSTESADAIEAYLKAETSQLGLPETKRSSFTSNDIENRTLVYAKAERELTVNLTIAPGKPLSVQVAYRANQ